MVDGKLGATRLHTAVLASVFVTLIEKTLRE